MRSYRLSIRSRAGAIALGIVVVAIGLVVIVSGLALLIGVVLIAGLLAGGAILLRRAFGRPGQASVRQSGVQRFDPSLEVFPPGPADPGPRTPDRIRPGDDISGLRRDQDDR